MLNVKVVVASKDTSNNLDFTQVIFLRSGYLTQEQTKYGQTFREVYLNLIKLFENCIWILSNFSRSVFELSNFSRSVFEFYQTFWEVYLNLIFEFLSFKCWICVPVCEEVTSMIEQLLLPGSTQKSGSHTRLVHLPGRIHLNRTRSTILSFEPVTRVYLLFILKGL